MAIKIGSAAKSLIGPSKAGANNCPLMSCVVRIVIGVTIKQKIIRFEYFSLKKEFENSDLINRATIDNTKQIADRTPNKPL